MRVSIDQAVCAAGKVLSWLADSRPANALSHLIRAAVHGHQHHIRENPDYARALTAVFSDLVRARSPLEVAMAILTAITVIYAALRPRRELRTAYDSWDQY